MTHQTSYEASAAIASGQDEFASIEPLPRAWHRVSPKSHRGGEIAKRCMDIIFSLSIALFFLPVIIVCWVLLVFSNGPVVFSQQRIGRGGKQFRVYKFRTMVPNAQQVLKDILASDPILRAEYERDHKLKNDPRVTVVGKFLRRTSLDELPQLWNIFKGEMSLVGPRPVEEFEMRKYGVHAHYYYSQRPGLTGLWQISGRSNVTYAQRVAMDTYYSRKRTLWLDLNIIFATVKVVLSSRGAY